MKTKLILAALCIVHVLSACQMATPLSSLAATLDNEFTLGPEQSAAVTDTDLTITFHSVVGDERCPREVECAASGPVTVSLSVWQGNGAPADFTLQTFTDQDGRSPNVQFEGVTNRAQVGDYLIQIVRVTPYPQNPTTKVQPSDYRLALLVSKH